jgi:hypothetical protein
MNEINEKAMNEKKRRLEAKESKELEPCWFCLGGSKVERHYIVSVGDKVIVFLEYGKKILIKFYLYFNLSNLKGLFSLCERSYKPRSSLNNSDRSCSVNYSCRRKINERYRKI